MRLAHVSLLLCLLVHLAGCSLFAARGPDRLPRDLFVPLDQAKERVLLESLQRSNSELQSMRLLLESTIRKGVTRQKGRQVVVFQRPDRLRAEFFATGLNKLMALVSVSGDAVGLLDTDSQTFYRGMVSVETMEQVASVPFLPDELMAWFAGRLRIPKADEPFSFRGLVHPESGQIAAQLHLADGRTMFALFQRGSKLDLSGSVTGPILLSSLEVTNELDKSLQFSATFSYGEAPFPERISFFLPRREAEGDLLVSQYEMNPDFGSAREKLFAIRVPPQVTVRELQPTQ